MPNTWKNSVNRALNLALYLVLCLLIGTGGMMWLRLPPGSGGGRGHGPGGEGGRSVLSLSRHEWGDVHLYLGLGFVAICLAHIALNWTWMMKIAASKRPWRVWAGLGAGLLLIIGLMMLPVR
jgi:hypothetical protein